MANVGRVSSPQLGMRLLISGAWSSQCDAEVERGGFDRLELHGGEYSDFSPLVQHERKITNLWINVPSKSTAGLSELRSLKTLSVSYELDKRFDFSALPSLRRLYLGAWLPWYAATVFKCASLELISIQGYGGKDCRDFSSLIELRALLLAKGSLTTLQGLHLCPRLTTIDLSHMRKLDDISDLAHVLALRELELGEGMSSLSSLEMIGKLSKLEKVDVSQSGFAINNVSWLANFEQLRVLYLPIVQRIDWAAVFHSRVLWRLKVRSADQPILTLENVLQVAREYGHRPKDSQAFGTKKIPGYFIEFEKQADG